MAKSGGGGGQRPQAAMAAMVLVRICLGAFWLYYGYALLRVRVEVVSLLKQATAANGAFVQGAAWDRYAAFLRHTIAPHAQVYAYVLMICALLAGLLLLVGLLTRLGALLAIAMSLFFLCLLWTDAPPHNFGDVSAVWSYGMPLLMACAVFIAAPGRVWGFDALLARKTKYKLLW